MRWWLWASAWERRTEIESRIRDDKGEEQQRDHHGGDEKRPSADAEVVAEIASEANHMLRYAGFF
jgi:hypothetical protein